MFEFDFLLSLEGFQDKLNCHNCDLPFEADPGNFPIFSPIFQTLLGNLMFDAQLPEQAETLLTNRLPRENILVHKPGHSEILTESTAGKDMPKEQQPVGRFLPGLLNIAPHRFMQTGVEELSLQTAAQATELQETDDSVLLKGLAVEASVGILNNNKLEPDFKRDAVFENLSSIADKERNDHFMLQVGCASIVMQDHEKSVAKFALQTEEPGLISTSNGQSNTSNGYALSVPVSINFSHASIVPNEMRADAPSQSNFDLDLKAANWEHGLGERMVWMVDKHIQTASMKLNPPELGPVEVELAMKKDQININFITHGVQAKEALDFAIPKLREMFLSSGLNLADVNVNDHQARQFAGQFSNQENAHRFFHSSYQADDTGNEIEKLETEMGLTRNNSKNILDIYT